MSKMQHIQVCQHQPADYLWDRTLVAFIRGVMPTLGRPTAIKA